MSGITPTDRLAPVLRQALQAGRRRASGAAPPPPAKHGATAIPPAVLRRVAAIDRGDPQRRHKALSIFLESILMRELGAQLLDDAAFPGLVEAVQEQIAQDTELAQAAHQLADLLLSA